MDGPVDILTFMLVRVLLYFLEGFHYKVSTSLVLFVSLGLKRKHIAHTTPILQIDAHDERAWFLPHDPICCA